MDKDQMNCIEAMPLLDAFADGELDDVPRLAIQNHLSACPACQAKVKTIEHLVTALKSLPRLAPSRDLSLEIDKHCQSKKQNNLIVQSPLIWASVSMAALTAALIFVLTRSSEIKRPVLATAPDSLAETKIKHQLSGAQPGRLPPLPTMPAQTGSAQIVPAREVPAPTAPGEHAQTVPAQTREAHNGRISGNQLLDDQTVAVARVDEIGLSTITGAIGLSTDEDGLYDIKI